MGFPDQHQNPPGLQSMMDPVPDCGEDSYVGSGRLTDKRAVITGGDSGIGRAVAIAFAREGADVLIGYLNEDEDAEQVAQLVRDAGRRCVLAKGDLSQPAQCRTVIERAVTEFGGIDILVSNAAFQMTHENLDEISDDEWDYTLPTFTWSRRLCRTWRREHRSSVVRQSTRICHRRLSRPMPPPRPRSRTSRRAWPNCWATREFASTAWLRARSGRH
jgi:NAD(P)-dependent dehydrogenase (short-subunit alcohol dehydrogenase family)